MGKLFAYNLFLRPTRDEILNAKSDWTIICAPGFRANPQLDNTRSETLPSSTSPKRLS
jgi:phosphoenolpyruvate carboxykinase (ATP)